MQHIETFPLSFLLVALVTACGSNPSPGEGGSGGTGGGANPGVPVLGSGHHTPDGVLQSVIGTSADGLDAPRDLAFNPLAPEELWVVNSIGPSMTIYFFPGDTTQGASTKAGLGGDHFMPRPSALAFGTNGMLATSQEESDITQPKTPADFMGPTLWPADSGFFNGGHASHMDMLHNSPKSAGIAWDHDNVYWVFDGHHSSITRYDFAMDHGPGGEDHSDGTIARYVEGQVSYVAGVSSHMELDRQTGMLYVADTGNGRVVVLDTKSGERGAKLPLNYDGVDQYEMLGATLTTLIDGAAFGLERPSGLALTDQLVFVGDNQTGRISAFDRNGGLIDYLDTGLPAGALSGLELGPEGHLYVVDALQSRVLEIEPLPAASPAL